MLLLAMILSFTALALCIFLYQKMQQRVQTTETALEYATQKNCAFRAAFKSNLEPHSRHDAKDAATTAHTDTTSCSFTAA